MGHGAKAKFSCRDGYELAGNRYTECRFGNWSGETPKCDEGTMFIIIITNKMLNVMVNSFFKTNYDMYFYSSLLHFPWIYRTW